MGNSGVAVGGGRGVLVAVGNGVTEGTRVGKAAGWVLVGGKGVGCGVGWLWQLLNQAMRLNRRNSLEKERINSSKNKETH